jgi:hypothetical protein
MSSGHHRRSGSDGSRPDVKIEGPPGLLHGGYVVAATKRPAHSQSGSSTSC